MVTVLRIVQALLLAGAVVNFMVTVEARQAGPEQICALLQSIALLLLVAILQRSGHRLADEAKAKRGAAGQ